MIIHAYCLPYSISACEATGALVIFPLQSTDGNNTVIWCGIERQGLYSFAKSEWKMARSRKASEEETEK